MEYWLNARDYKIVQPQDVNIPNYTFTVPERPHVATSIDGKLPHILEKLFQDTVSVRVLSKTCTKHKVEVLPNGEKTLVAKKFTKQLFLFVRDVLTKKFTKKELMVICSKYMLADIVLVANAIQPAPAVIFYRKAIECKLNAEIIATKDLTFPKLQSRMAPRYVVLNKREVKALEERFKTKKTCFPRLVSSDPMAKYFGLRPGSVVKNIKAFMSYRIVV
jgi:DNA-directed RNA polymerase subunit H (RpoH/RPB5)